MENVPKNRDRERMDAVLDWGAEGWRLAHLLRHRLSTLEPTEMPVDVGPGPELARTALHTALTHQEDS